MRDTVRKALEVERDLDVRRRLQPKATAGWNLFRHIDTRRVHPALGATAKIRAVLNIGVRHVVVDVIGTRRFLNLNLRSGELERIRVSIPINFASDVLEAGEDLVDFDLAGGDVLELNGLDDKLVLLQRVSLVADISRRGISARLPVYDAADSAAPLRTLSRSVRLHDFTKTPTAEKYS